jgi:hypothetical protein
MVEYQHRRESAPTKFALDAVVGQVLARLEK